MVCRTPGFSEVGPLSITQGELDLRDLNESYPRPSLRLVTVAEEDERAESARHTAETVVPSYEVWQYMPRECRERRVATARQQRAAARRKQAKRTERAVFQMAAAAASLVAIIGCVRIVEASYSSTPTAVQQVTVAPGDTLWTMASHYTPAGVGTSNTVRTIRAINPALNGSAQLHVGQRLFVPAQRG